MPSKPLIVLGTGNRKKGRELAELFALLPIEFKTLADFPEAESVVESGDTFAANAVLKAVEQGRRLARWVLGEDSGLMVDALDGAPGVFSARYSGGDATDHSNNRRLLDELAGVPAEKRTARFVCHMAISDPAGSVCAQSEGRCRGRILFEPQGAGGFGYDPLFEIVEHHRSFAQLGPLVKSILSHRARAAGQLVPLLLALVDSGRLGGR